MTLAQLPRLLASAVPPPLRVLRRSDGPAPLPPAGKSGGGFGRGFSALRHRNYRIYWFGQIGSLIGAWMQSVTLPWLVLLLGGSPLELGLALALQFAPSTFLAPIGGVMADRIDKRRTLMTVQAIAMLQAATLFALAITGVVEIWHVYALALVAGFVHAVEMPVRQSFAAELVPSEDLVNAIALNSTSFNLARVIGPAIAGITIAVFGVAFNFGANALSYLGVLTALAFMDPTQLRRTSHPERFPTIRSSLAEGVRYAARTPTVLWPLVLLGGTALFAMNFQTLLPLFARDTLGMGSNGYGALFAAMGLGALGGSLTLAFATSQRPMLRFILGGGLAFLAFELLLGLSRAALFAFPLVVAIGFASMLMVNTINVTVQNAVPHELRGRVMSLYVTVFAGTAPLGGLFAGGMAQLFGAPAGFLLGAGLASAVLALAAWRMLRRPFVLPLRSSGLDPTDAPAVQRVTTEAPGPPGVQRQAG